RLLPDLELAAIRAARASTDGARAVAEALSSEGGRLPFAALLVESGEDPEMRRRAEAVAQRIAAKLVPAFLALSEHPAADVRAAALEFLAARSEPESVRAVVAGIGDPNPETRRTVLASLGPRHASAADAVIALAQNPDWSVRV